HGPEVRQHLADIWGRLETESDRLFYNQMTRDAQEAPALPPSSGAGLRSSVPEILTGYRVSGVRSSPRRLAQDVIRTGAVQPHEAMASMRGAVHDMVMGAGTKQRALTAENPASFARSYIEGGAKGLREAPEIWKHGATKEQLDRLEFPHELN